MGGYCGGSNRVGLSRCAIQPVRSVSRRRIANNNRADERLMDIACKNIYDHAIEVPVCANTQTRFTRELPRLLMTTTYNAFAKWSKPHWRCQPIKNDRNPAFLKNNHLFFDRYLLTVYVGMADGYVHKWNWLPSPGD